MAKYALNYFPATAKGEPARLMFVLCGVEFKDNLIGGEEWQKAKQDSKRFPLGQMPTLEVDGEVICQSSAIYKFVGDELGLYGDNPRERAVTDQVLETINEILMEFGKIVFSPEPAEKKKEMYEETFKTEKIQLRWKFLETIAKGDFFLKDKIMFPDLLLFSYSEMFREYFPAVLDGFDKLKDIVRRVGENERIKQHIATRKY